MKPRKQKTKRFFTAAVVDPPGMRLRFQFLAARMVIKKGRRVLMGEVLDEALSMLEATYK